MKKLNNPFIKDPHYNCYGCHPNNQAGLQMKFADEGEWVTALWTPQHDFEGYVNVLHGGVQAALLDEVSAWSVFVKKGVSGVTLRLNIKYKKPVLCNLGDVLLRSKIIEEKRNICLIHAELINAKQELCAEAEAHFYLYSKEQSVSDFLFPESIDEFYEN